MIYINGRFLTQETSGVQRFAIEISKELKRKYPGSYKWVAPKNILQKEVADFLEVELVGDNEGHMWEQLDLPKYLKKNGTPVLLSMCNMAPLFYSNKISTIHDMAFFENPSWFSKKFALVYRVFIPKIVKTSKKVLSVSKFSESEIRKYIPQYNGEIGVVPNGISDKFRDVKMPKENYILTVGSIDPRKNLAVTIDAFQSLGKPGLKLVIIGARNKVFTDKRVWEKIKSNKNIEFTGYLTDEQIVSYYQNAKLFINSSLYEGFGIPPLEAMACGTPVLVSDIPVYKELFQGAVAFFTDMEDLILKMNILLDSEPKRLVLQRAGELLVKNYSWSKSADIINEEIKGV